MESEMLKTFAKYAVAALVALAVTTTGPAGTALAGGEGGNQDRMGMPLFLKDEAKGRDGLASKRASPREWFDRDADGKPVTGVRRSRITGRYTVSRYGRDPRNGRIVPVWVRTFSAKEWEKMTTYDGRTDTTTITIPRGGNRVRTVQVDGDATWA
jgi:hypothetical protein